MKQLLSYFFLSTIFFSTAFTPIEKQAAENTKVVTYDNTDLQKVEIKDVQYIPLETTDQSLIGETNKVLYRNGLFYVMDTSKSKTIFTFDDKGNFRSSIAKSGNGPGEYVELTDMDVDAAGNVYVADNANKRLIKYIKGNSKQFEIIPVGVHFLGFACLQDTKFILSDVFGQKGQRQKLALLDATDGSLKTLLAVTTNDIDEMSILRMSPYPLYRSADALYYNERFMPMIYTFNKEGDLQQDINLESNRYIPHSELKSLAGNPMKYIKEHKYIKDIISIYETSDYLVCQPFIFPSAEYLIVPKDKTKKSYRISLQDQPALKNISMIKAVTKNKLVSVMNYNEESPILQKKHAALKGWNEDSNPVLVLFSPSN